MTKIASMDSNSTPKRLPAERVKNRVDGSFQKEAQDVRNGAPSLKSELDYVELRHKLKDFLTSQTKEDLLDWLEMDRVRMKKAPAKSGWKMARIV